MLRTEHGTRTIDELRALYRSRRLELSPAFQRQSVWNTRDRRYLIESVLAGVPLPTIYLTRHAGHRGVPKYDVIDGKQRLETILLFVNDGPLAPDGPLSVRTAVDDGEPSDWWAWADLGRAARHRFLATKVPTIEVEGQLADIIDLFVRINSTGKRLTGQERRHANYHQSGVLRIAHDLADRRRDWLVRNRVLTTGQVQRMRHVELMAELVLAARAGEPLNKKQSIDRILRDEGIRLDEVREAATRVDRAIGVLETMLPDLRTTRFRNTSDFYSVISVLHRMRDEGKVVNRHQSSRNSLAGDLLRSFGQGVDEVITRMGAGKGLLAEQEPMRDYVAAVRADTDSAKSRRDRERQLRQLLEHVFDDRDPVRTFNATQRRVAWHASSTKTCCFCAAPIRRWEDMAVDHVKPHSRGGRTVLENAAIAHRRCNAAAGAKYAPASRR